MANNTSLGRGLASLIPPKKGAPIRTISPIYRAKGSGSGDELIKPQMSADKTDEQRSVLEVSLASIKANPLQPRDYFDETALKELAQSIKEHGIIQPLVVIPAGANEYELLAGERRLKAAKIVGLEKVPVVLREESDNKNKLELALIENIQRQNLNAIEEAKAYEKLIDEYKLTQEEVSEEVGKSRSAVTNKLRLLGLPVEIQKAIITGKISEGHARTILALDNPEKQRALFEMILKENLSVRDTENKVREVTVATHKRKIAPAADPALQQIEGELGAALGTKVQIKKTGKGGRIVIDYYSQEELQNIIKKIVHAV